MKIIIKSTNLKLTPTIYNYVEEKIRSLGKFIEKIGIKARPFKKGKDPIEIWMEIGRTTFRHRKGKVFRAEAQVRFPGKSIRAEAVQSDLHLAIDEVKDELQREFKKYQGRKISQRKRRARKAKRIFRISPGARFPKRKRVREEGI